MLAAFAVTATTTRREVTLARFALLVEAAADVSAWATGWLRSAGSARPARDAALLGAQVDAMTLHQLAYPDRGFDPLPARTEPADAVIDRRPARPGRR